MIDGCGREIDHLRLSLTDHCNLACRYCIPAGAKPSGQMIDVDFAFQAVRWLSERHGIRFVRLTGGEPLLYPDLIPLIQRLRQVNSLGEITLTTNAQALAHKAVALRAAGLTRINISLDALDPGQFERVTRGGNITHTLAGIQAAVDVGLTPVKINVVVQRGLNDDELVGMAEWGLARGCIVRFLEVMPIGPMSHVVDQHLVPASEILERLSRRFELRPIPQSVGQPATDYAATAGGVRGVIGVIAPTTRPFCERCRRIRITSRGAIVACLHDSKSLDLIQWWDGRVLDVDRADGTLRKAINDKAAVGPLSQSLTMLSLGG
ncbi:MAG: GTP 3',8-cyclase MoaA [Phycisphaerae bacterium]